MSSKYAMAPSNLSASSASTSLSPPRSLPTEHETLHSACTSLMTLAASEAHSAGLCRRSSSSCTRRQEGRSQGSGTSGDSGLPPVGGIFSNYSTTTV